MEVLLVMYMKYAIVFLVAIVVVVSGFAAAMFLDLQKSPGNDWQQSMMNNTNIDTASGSIKFKVLHGSIADNSSEVGGVYYIFLNMRSFGEDFAPWLVYMALTKDYEWWSKEFSVNAAKAAGFVKKRFQEHRIPPLRPEDIPRYRKEIAAAIYEWWLASLWEEVIGSCIPPFYVEVMIGDQIYAVFYTQSRGCIDQYSKVLGLGGRFDLTVIWASGELKPGRGDFKTVPGWSSIYTLDSGFAEKLLKVIELSGLWNETWISISILSAGHNVGGQPVYPNITDYQYYNTSKDMNVKDLVNELIEKFPDAVKILLPPSKTDAIVFVKLTKLNEVLKLLESRGTRLGIPTNAIVIFR